MVLSIKVILYSKAFKHVHYKKVFIDENPKKWLSDMKKLKKALKKCPEKNSSVIYYIKKKL